MTGCAPDVDCARRTRLSRVPRAPLAGPARAAMGQAFLIAIFFSLFWASNRFGKVTASIPFLKLASILSSVTPSGTPNERWNEP